MCSLARKGRVEAKYCNLTIADTYARFSGSCLLDSFTNVQVMPAAVLPRAVRSIICQTLGPRKR